MFDPNIFDPMSGNRLDQETSPYLRQHKENPVHWRPWDAQALAEAKQAEKPILLSIGYAACHWCHVMAHESFEDVSIAALINDCFIPIKVDREERPDIDWIYQHALALTGEQGGWPLTMFLTPQGEPFWGGTYFPPEPRYGRPSFEQVLHGVIQSRSNQGDRIAYNVQALHKGLQSVIRCSPGSFPSRQFERGIALKLLDAIDGQYGGLAGAPKFPQVPLFTFLWRHGLENTHNRSTADPNPHNSNHRQAASEDLRINPRHHNPEHSDALSDDGPLSIPQSQRLQDAVLLTLRMICQGGIYDHLGGGFSRYSTDSTWLVPHFEKMLYDNALILEWLIEAWRHTQDPLFAERIDETIGWLGREMGAEADGFAASLDADSPISGNDKTKPEAQNTQGEEGAYYVWRADELDAILRKNSGLLKDIYGVTEEGNWEGRCILNRLNSRKHSTQQEEKTLSYCKSLLLSERARRPPPQRDDKVLTDWNGMTIAALAKMGMVFGDNRVLDLAHRAYRGVRAALSEGPTGRHRLHHALCSGQARHPATLDDYAHMARAALLLYEATFYEKSDKTRMGKIGHRDLLQDAQYWVSIINADYWDTENGGYYMTAERDDLILRPKTAADQATPSGNAVACEVLARLYLLTGQAEYQEKAQAVLAAFSGAAAARPVEHCALFNARDWLENPLQIILVGPKTDPTIKSFQKALQQRSLPTALVIHHTDNTNQNGTEKLPPNHPVRGKKTLKGQATAYICRGPVCGPPMTTQEDLLRAIDE